MTMGKACTTVVVFAKPPRAGLAKTRLAQSIGSAAAARLAQAFFDDTWGKVCALDSVRAIVATIDPADPAWKGLGSVEVWPQGDGDLGMRMERVLRRALDGGRPAIVLGTDVPLVAVDWLASAAGLLQSFDAVIGPAEDGGFYLLGLRRCPAGLLAGIAWSTSQARAQTMAALTGRGLTVAELPTTFDVDRPDDLDRLRRAGRVLESRAPRTVAALARMTDVLSGSGS